MTQPDISVCIITYNQRAYIRQCIESVLEQKSRRISEIIVGDDGSDDGTSKIVASYSASHPELLRHVRRPHQLGPSGNLQELYAQAKGDYIAHLDGDDYWLPGKTQRQAEFLDAHQECVAVYCNAITVTDKDQRIGIFNDAGDAFCDLPSLFRKGNFLNTSSMLFRREHRSTLTSVEGPFIDYRIHLLLAQHGLLGHMAEPLVAYRVHATGAMTSNSGDKVRELYWEAMQSIPEKLLSDEDRARGLADFLRRVFGASRRRLQWEPMRIWAPQVFKASPYGRLRTSILTLASIAHIGKAELLGKLKGENSRVLYRH